MNLCCIILLGTICISSSFFTSKYERRRSAAAAIYAQTVKGPDADTKPDYEQIHGPLGKTLDRLFLTIFRTRMAEQVGIDSSLPKDDYQGLMELTGAMNARFSDRTEVQKTAQNILRSLFPSWLPRQYASLFSRPFPQFSARMNAWATRVAGTWLMGECELNDVEVDGKLYKDQGLLVKRCRFLEESGCASVCVNACKIPTQNFFIEDMGLPLTMVPDYETGECQFSFGRMPTVEEEMEAKATPCLSRCPTGGSLRRWHDGNRESVDLSPISLNETSSACQFMDAA
ncbi:unnamed protein product [Cylindrotheca closterium]|uniref:Beta-carotene isomerase D27-like C-terminal domain-containing protein n=1 Tax=Cylindrotheca closterium TaxID=2856 RepID=A0AAD2CR91_9STRA|nr:unnamed protein product [Cylindrotheca closterium]